MSKIKKDGKYAIFVFKIGYSFDRYDDDIYRHEIKREDVRIFRFADSHKELLKEWRYLLQQYEGYTYCVRDTKTGENIVGGVFDPSDYEYIDDYFAKPQNSVTPVAVMLDNAIDYIVQYEDDEDNVRQILENNGIDQKSLNACGINRFDYLFVGDIEETVLTCVEYNGLCKIASETKMDCWFDLQERTKDGVKFDVVFDAENDETLSIREGIAELAEGLVEPLDSAFYGLSAQEYQAVCKLFARFDIVVPTKEKHHD